MQMTSVDWPAYLALLSPEKMKVEMPYICDDLPDELADLLRSGSRWPVASLLAEMEGWFFWCTSCSPDTYTYMAPANLPRDVYNRLKGRDIGIKCQYYKTRLEAWEDLFNLFKVFNL